MCALVCLGGFESRKVLCFRQLYRNAKKRTMVNRSRWKETRVIEATLTSFKLYLKAQDISLRSFRFDAS